MANVTWSYGLADCSTSGEGLTREAACKEAQRMANEQGRAWSAWEAREGGTMLYFEPAKEVFGVLIQAEPGKDFRAISGWDAAYYTEADALAACERAKGKFHDAKCVSMSREEAVENDWLPPQPR